jgi:hypothetical protein
LLRYRETSMRRPITRSLIVAALASAIVAPAFAADPCAGFKWDVSKEHALFSGPATTLTAGRDAGSAPAIDTDRLYELKLTPQDQTAFALAPGKKMLTDGAFAGLATFKVNTSGAYRVSVDVPFWIDVVAGGKPVATKDFQGQHACDAPHKIVEFELTAAQPLVLQLSGSTKSVVRLTVTQSSVPNP